MYEGQWSDLEHNLRKKYWLEITRKIYDAEKFLNLVKTYCKEINIKDQEVKTEAKSHSGEQDGVDPWGHDGQGLVLGQAVDGVGHLDGDEDWQSHGHWFGGLENVAADTLELLGFGGAL